MNIEKKANNLLCIFSEYMDDYMLEEFFTDRFMDFTKSQVVSILKNKIKEMKEN